MGMSTLKDKIRVNDVTYYFIECPNCLAHRKFDKAGILAISMMGAGSIAAILSVFAFVGTVGIPYTIMLTIGGRWLSNTKLAENIGDKLTNMTFKLAMSTPIFKRWEKEGIGVFKCPDCGNNEIIREEN
jgi:hypothetical protein